MGLGSTAVQASLSLHNPKEPLPDHPPLAFEVKYTNTGFPGDSVVKNLPENAGDVDSIPGSGTPPGEGNGNPLQYSCLGNPMNRGPMGSQIRHVLATKQ